ncbi:hypothetical protein Bca4012_009989 [Brassica carinata]
MNPSRYGPLFRTNIFGSKTVVSTDPDANFQIFRQENTSFEQGYPEILVAVFGKDNLFLNGLDMHKYLKTITMQLVGSEGLKRTMIGNMDKAIHDHLRLKASQGSFDVRKEVESLVITYMTPNLISNLEQETQSKLFDHLKSFNLDWFQSFFSLSTWKALIKVMKARREVIQLMKDVLMRRKESREKQNDFLNTMLEEMEKDGSVFDEGSAINLIFLISFATREGTSGCTALAVKFISENPQVLQELKREHKAIRYTIPAGWVVAVAPSVVHYDPKIYENPFEFNPWRWEGKELMFGSKTFMAFGGGVRLCIGAEFARLQMAIFLHHLVTYYDFSLVQDCEVTRTPFLQFTQGLLINISQLNPADSKSQ